MPEGKPIKTYYFDVVPPAKWRAGFIGADPDQKPFYFACCECGAKGPEMAGIICTAPTGKFEDIALLPVKDSPFVNPAMYCSDCWKEKVDEAIAKGWKVIEPNKGGLITTTEDQVRHDREMAAVALVINQLDHIKTVVDQIMIIYDQADLDHDIKIDDIKGYSIEDIIPHDLEEWSLKIYSRIQKLKNLIKPQG